MQGQGRVGQSRAEQGREGRGTARKDRAEQSTAGRGETGRADRAGKSRTR